LGVYFIHYLIVRLPAPLCLGFDLPGLAGTAKGDLVDATHAVVKGVGILVVVGFVFTRVAGVTSGAGQSVSPAIV
jgi:hypothetical protein